MLRIHTGRVQAVRRHMRVCHKAVKAAFTQILFLWVYCTPASL